MLFLRTQNQRSGAAKDQTTSTRRLLIYLIHYLKSFKINLYQLFKSEEKKLMFQFLKTNEIIK